MTSTSRYASGLAPLAEESESMYMQARRPKRRGRSSIGCNPTIIYEDTFAWKGSSASSQPTESASNSTLSTSLSANRRSILLSQPAQRFPVSSSQDCQSTAPRHAGCLTSKILEEETMTIKKDPRRRTIYIPSDDTTIATIHPGASLRDTSRLRRPRKSDIFLDIAELADMPHSQYASGTGREEQQRRPRQSLTIPPKRIPLAPCRRTSQPSGTMYDIPGTGDGKENLFGLRNYQGETLDLNLSKNRISMMAPSPKRCTSVALSCGGNSPVEPNNLVAEPRADCTLTKGFLTSFPKKRTSLLPAQIRRASTAPTSSSSTCDGRSQRQQSNRKVIPVLGHSTKPYTAFPVLQEDLLQPELYEEHWLGHQETAITECINSILLSGTDSVHCATKISRERENLLAIYHDSTMSLLHRRLQASLQFGALSISRDTLSQVGCYVDDLQQRQRFLDLWLKTYNLQSLQAAAEVVIGREMTAQTASPSPAQSSAGTTLKRTLESYLMLFLVHNDDARRGEAALQGLQQSAFTGASCSGQGTQAWAWRRTVVRSLSLILLLDKAQVAGFFEGCLFQTSSPLKSSTAVIQALATLLIPSIGNMSRVLEHLSFSVSHSQSSLEEVSYKIENLATDLRDGVLLTRLVELLLYSRGSTSCQERSITMKIPSGETLTSAPVMGTNLEKNSWILSPHLRYPCISRAQKLFNVQIALNALAEAEGTENLLHDIRAADIVDGHREKNVGLLWSLVGRWGLDRLVDFGLVEKEILRMGKIGNCAQKAHLHHGAAVGGLQWSHLQGLKRHKAVLLAWAQFAACLHGTTVSNLSTSFADGKAYKAIIAEYGPCLASTSKGCKNSTCPTVSLAGATTSAASNTDPALSGVLLSLGCSQTFISLFKNIGTIPSSETTVSLLAFLASRLIPPARLHFAALLIQRQWRRRQARFELKRKIRLALLARDCATVVVARQGIINAAVKIQRWWRALEAYWIRPRTHLKQSAL